MDMLSLTPPWWIGLLTILFPTIYCLTHSSHRVNGLVNGGGFTWILYFVFPGTLISIWYLPAKTAYEILGGLPEFVRASTSGLVGFVGYFGFSMLPKTLEKGRVAKVEKRISDEVAARLEKISRMSIETRATQISAWEKGRDQILDKLSSKGATGIQWARYISSEERNELEIMERLDIALRQDS